MTRVFAVTKGMAPCSFVDDSRDNGVQCRAFGRFEAVVNWHMVALIQAWHKLWTCKGDDSENVTTVGGRAGQARAFVVEDGLTLTGKVVIDSVGYHLLFSIPACIYQGPFCNLQWIETTERETARRTKDSEQKLQIAKHSPSAYRRPRG